MIDLPSIAALQGGSIVPKAPSGRGQVLATGAPRGARQTPLSVGAAQLGQGMADVGQAVQQSRQAENRKKFVMGMLGVDNETRNAAMEATGGGPNREAAEMMNAAPGAKLSQLGVPENTQAFIKGLVDQGMYDEAFGVLAPFAKPGQGDPFTLKPGEQRFDAQGRAIASVAAEEKTPASIQEWRIAKRDGLISEDMTYEQFKRLGRNEASAKYGNTPIWGTDANGNPVLMQPSSAGGVRLVDLPEGVTPQRGQTSRVDVGDKFAILDANGTAIGFMPKGLGPDRTIQDDRVVTLPAVPGGQPQAASPQPQAPGQAAPQPEMSATPATPVGGVPAQGLQPSVQELPPSREERREEGERQRQADQRQQMVETQAGIVTQDIDRLVAALDEDPTIPLTGILGVAGSYIPGTPQHDFSRTLETVLANIGFDKLQAMRDASATGGALGQVSEFENRLLQATAGNVQQSQSVEQLRRNLLRVREIYNRIIHQGIPDDEARQMLAEMQGGSPQSESPQGGSGAGWSIKRID